LGPPEAWGPWARARHWIRRHCWYGPISDVKAKILASVSASSIWPSVLLIWPRKMCYPMQNNISCIISWLCHCNIHYTLSTLMWDTNSVVLLALSPCVLIQNYLHLAGLDLGLGLEELASASASVSWFWPRTRSFGLVQRHCVLYAVQLDYVNCYV